MAAKSVAETANNSPSEVTNRRAAVDSFRTSRRLSTCGIAIWLSVRRMTS